MNIDTFLRQHGLHENPFEAEEARHDPVFERLIDSASHPDFTKVLGRIDQPSTAVVFGEKGSGKTAIRLMIGKRVADHNRDEPDRKTLLVAYDDLNPVLDRLMHRRQHAMGFRRASKAREDELLRGIRLEDHQDAILSLAVTRIVDAVLGDGDGEAGECVTLPVGFSARKLPRHARLDLAILAALYDQPRHGSVAKRWARLRSKLRLGWVRTTSLLRFGAAVLTVAGSVLAIVRALQTDPPVWMLPVAGLGLAGAAVLWGVWLWRHYRLWSLCRQVHREMHAVERTPGDLRVMLMDLRPTDIEPQPWPLVGNHDSRYQLTARLLGVLEPFGYHGIMVLIDRVDEPTVVSGKPERMRAIVWPFFDNKFLQQSSVGVKLLLPVELRHMLHRESADFFQEARLDKQNLIDRLTWSGATLYDLATRRLQACVEAGAGASVGFTPEGAVSANGVSLRDLFTQDVSRQMLVDALDQMQQPRDAFKFLYSLIQEHCKSVPDDEPDFHIARPTLDAIRRQQSQRVQDLYRGVAPA